MKILLVHNRYVHEGGEDMVFATSTDLLRHFGHEVVRYTDDNRRISGIGRWRMAVKTHWSAGSVERLTRLFRRETPAVAHFHNTFPLISPSAYYACRSAGIPVVQTLHNYRLVCAGSLLLRNGRLCEDCLRKILPWPGILHACYRGSRSQSAAVASMLVFHRLLGTWNLQVDMFIAPSAFTARELIKGGLPEGRIAVMPNFVHPDPGLGECAGGYALFVGRLSEEKGIAVLLGAWRGLNDIPLVMVGEGPLMDRVRGFARSRPEGEIRLHGRCSRKEVFGLMKGARMLVFPSPCPEVFSMVIAEAFACGLTVVAPDAGAAAEIVENLRTGLLFRSGEPKDLADKVAWLWSHPGEARRMGREARAEFEAKYTAERNYPLLMDIYSRAMKNRQGRSSADHE
jgi:glycosyltransferase involved in cell wall biosynthesis